MPKLIEIRKLAALDMAWLGPRVIVAEYLLGVVLPLALGVFTLRIALSSPLSFSSQTILGIWLLTIAANYVPLVLYAVSIAKSGTVQAKWKPEMKHARRYGVQQIIILVPFAVVVLAIYQGLNGEMPSELVGDRLFPRAAFRSADSQTIHLDATRVNPFRLERVGVRRRLSFDGPQFPLRSGPQSVLRLPIEPEWVLHFAIAVAPELFPDQR